MKISELEGCPNWLRNADTLNADVEMDQDEYVTWHGGIWLSGTWMGSIWHGGTWMTGTWLGGTWHGGTWHGGIWMGGIWRHGTWRGGTWLGGIWHGGTWHGGTWHGGTWMTGTWLGIEDRVALHCALLGIVFNQSGVAIAYRTTEKNGKGRYNPDFTQTEGTYFESNLPESGSGTCIRGIHVTSALRAWTYFGVDPTCQLWEVTFKREDLLDADGEKCRIRGGVFKPIKNFLLRETNGK